MASDKIAIGDLPLLGRLCIFSEFFYGLCSGAWSIALNFHLSANGVSEGHIGILLCIGYLITAIVSFFVGRLGDKKGFPFVMASGALTMGAALFLIAQAHKLVWFYLGHMLYSIGLAYVMSMEYNLPLSLIKDEQRQYGYNLVLVFFFLGSIVGTFLCSVCLPILPDQQDPYRYILLICAVCYGFLALFRGRMPQQSSTSNGSETNAHAFRTLLSSRKVLSYLLYGFLAFGVLTMATGMLNLVLRLWHNMSNSAIGLVFSVNSLVGCLILAILPTLIHRTSLYSLSKFALTAQCVALAGMMLLPAGPFVGMIFLRTISCNMLYTTADSPMLQSIVPHLRGTYSGMRVFANYFGMSFASVFSGWLVDIRCFRGLFLACTAMALAQLLTYFLLCRPFLPQLEKGKEDILD